MPSIAGGLTLTQYSKFSSEKNAPQINQVAQLLPVPPHARGFYHGYMVPMFPRGAHFGAAPTANCPYPSRYVKGRGCCLDPKFRPPGAPQKQQCCAPGKARIVKHGTKYSMSCKPGGGPGPSPGPGGSSSGRITSINGNQITVSGLSGIECPPGKPNVEMRRNAPGLAEFVGDVTGSCGANCFTISLGALAGKSGYVKPQVGESVYLWCAPNDGGEVLGGITDSIGGLFGFGEEGGSSSLVKYGVIAALVVGGYYLFKKANQPSYTPAARRR